MHFLIFPANRTSCQSAEALPVILAWAVTSSSHCCFPSILTLECSDAQQQLAAILSMPNVCMQEDLKHLRSLWDMVTVVMGAFTSWCATLWDKIDVDFLVEETKRLAKEIRTLNKVVRAFDVYR